MRSGKEGKIRLEGSLGSFVRSVGKNGLVRGVDGSVWLYAVLDFTTNLLDGATRVEREGACLSLLSFFRSLSDLVPPAALKFRELMKASYREFHFLSLALPQAFLPTPDFLDLASWHREAYTNEGFFSLKFFS